MLLGRAGHGEHAREDAADVDRVDVAAQCSRFGQGRQLRRRDIGANPIAPGTFRRDRNHPLPVGQTSRVLADLGEILQGSPDELTVAVGLLSGVDGAPVVGAPTWSGILNAGAAENGSAHGHRALAGRCQIGSIPAIIGGVSTTGNVWKYRCSMRRSRILHPSDVRTQSSCQ